MSQNHIADSDSRTDTVTRDQGGQFIDEGSMLFTPDLQEAALAGDTDAQLTDSDRSSVNALQVNMERSGAEYIHAQKSFLTNSGAREITSDTAKLTQSGVLNLNAKSAEFKQSSAVIVGADTLTLSESRAVVANADKVTTDGASSFGVLTASNVEASGDVRAFMLTAGDIKAGGNVTTTISGQSAGILGIAFAVTLAVLIRLFGKRS